MPLRVRHEVQLFDADFVSDNFESALVVSSDGVENCGVVDFHRLVREVHGSA